MIACIQRNQLSRPYSSNFLRPLNRISTQQFNVCYKYICFRKHENKTSYQNGFKWLFFKSLLFSTFQGVKRARIIYHLLLRKFLRVIPQALLVSACISALDQINVRKKVLPHLWQPAHSWCYDTDRYEFNLSRVLHCSHGTDRD